MILYVAVAPCHPLAWKVDLNKLDRNMAILKNCRPDFACWLESGSTGSALALAPTPSQSPDLQFNSGLESKLVYGVEDPRASARNAAESNLNANTKVVFLFGLGLGYLAESLISRLGSGQSLFIVEENREVIKLTFGLVDFSLPMARNKVYFIEPDRPGLERFAKDLAEVYRQGQLSILVDENCRSYFSAEFTDTIQRFLFVVRSEAGKRQALFLNGDRAVENEIANLPLTLLAQDLGELKDSLAGRPALVISAGPSLADQVHLLPQALGKAALIATAPVLRLLASYDVRPDLVGILDYSPDNHTVLRDVYGTEDVPLVFMEGTFPRVIRDYQGKLISVLHTHGPVRQWLAPVLAHREHLPSGTNVGAFCLQLAIYLGADPIILVGQDLAYPDQTTHSEGVVGRRKVNGQVDSPDQVWLDSVAGGKVLSTITLASYLEEFNQIIKLNPRTYINTSPNGARIHGAVEMSLEETFEHHLRTGRQVTGIFRETSPGGASTVSAVAQELSSLETEIKDLKVVVAKALVFSQDIKALLDRDTSPHDHELLNLINVHGQYTNGALKYVRKIGPLRQYLAEPLRQLKNEELRFRGDRDWRETITEYLNDKDGLMTAVEKGIDRLSVVVNQSRTELEDVTEIMCGRLLADSVPALNRAAQTWARLGRLNQAWTCLRQALALRPDSVETVLAATRLCLQRERPRQAVELLRHFSADGYDPKKLAHLIKEAEATAQIWLSSAENLLNQNDWVSALINVRKYLAYEPTDSKARQLEARCLEERAKRVESARNKARQSRNATQNTNHSLSNDMNPCREDATKTGTQDDPRLDLEKKALLLGPKECRCS